MKRALALAASAFLIAAPFAVAQPTDQPPAEPPPVTQPNTPPTEPTPPPTDPATPTTPPVSTPPSASTPAPEGCRTRQPAGEQCACLSDTSRIGASTAHPDGHNVCVRPD